METSIPQVYSNMQFGSVPVIVVDGKEMFGATQIASVLGYSNPQKAIRDHCKGDGCTIRSVIDSLGRTQQMKFISEGNVYRLIVRSKLPAADKFERWLFDEVIPAVRTHGGYLTPTKVEEVLLNPDTIIHLATQLKREREEKERLQFETVRQAGVIEEQAERLTYLDEILQSEGTVCVTQIAADYDLTARTLNNILKLDGIQRKVNEQWVLTKKYLGQDLAESQTIPITLQGGRRKTKMHTRWTQKGRLLIHEILTERGIEANRDRTLSA